MVVALESVAGRAEDDAIKVFRGIVGVDVYVDPSSLVAVGGEATDAGDLCTREGDNQAVVLVKIDEVVGIEAAEVEAEVVHGAGKGDRDGGTAGRANG